MTVAVTNWLVSPLGMIVALPVLACSGFRRALWYSSPVRGPYGEMDQTRGTQLRMSNWLLGLLSRLLGRRVEETQFHDPEHPDNWLSLDLILDQVAAQLDAQADAWDDVDGRLRLILGFIGIIFAVVAGFLRASSPGSATVGQPPAGQLAFAVGAPAIAAVGVYLLAGVIIAWVYWPTTFDRPPAPAALRNNYLTTDARETKLVVIDSMIEAYSKNELVLARRTRAFKIAFVLTGAATALLGGAVMIQLALQTTVWVL
jgi:hypothetical protein